MKRLLKKTRVLAIAVAMILLTGVVPAQAAVKWAFSTSNGEKKASVNATITMEKGEFQDMNLYRNGKQIKVNDATYKVSWYSSNSNVVYVNKADGKMRADKYGKMSEKSASAKITAVIKNKKTGSTTKKSFTVKVKVTPTPSPTPIPYDYSGVAKKNGTLYYYSDGKVDYNFEGLGKYEGTLRYFKNGTEDSEFTGVTYNEDGMWYVKKGVVDKTYCGEVEFLGKTVEVVDGQIDSDLVVEQQEQALLTVEEQAEELVLNESESYFSSSVEYEERRAKNVFTAPRDGLYSIEVSNRNLFWEVLDPLNKCVISKRGDAVQYVLLYEGVSYTISHGTSSEKRYVAYSGFSYNYSANYHDKVSYIGDATDVSNASVIKNRFDESFFSEKTIKNGNYEVIRYSFVPEETAKYTIWFDDLNISKNKTVYKDNPIFKVEIWKGDSLVDESFKSYECALSSENTAYQFTAEAGEEYLIKILVTNTETEKYKNGDVEYTMYIDRKQVDRNITGYTSVSDYIAYGGKNNINTYVLTPVRKETVNFTISQLREDASVDIVIKSSSGIVIDEYTGLKNGNSFAIADTLKDNKYTIEVVGSRDTNYRLDIEYK